MNIKELRIGNLVNHKKKQVVEIKSIGIICLTVIRSIDTINVPFNELSPTPITPEWLEKLGFKRDEFNDYQLSIRDFIIHFYTDDGLSCELSTRAGTHFTFPPCDYVHQLQNLAHALTGEELEVGK